MPTIEKSGRVVTFYLEAHNLLGPASEEPLLHPDTAPEVIAARQRQDVLVAWGAGLSDPAAIGRALVLPVGSVRRFLFELGLGPDPHAKVRRGPLSGTEEYERRCAASQAAGRKQKADTAAAVAAALSGGPLTVGQISERTGLCHQTVKRALADNGFPAVGKKRYAANGLVVPAYGQKVG